MKIPQWDCGPAIARRVLLRVAACLLVTAGALGAETPSDNDGTVGQFWRLHWYEHGSEHANPEYDPRFRVNSPEVVLHPEFGKRVEARSNGLMLILAEEDLSLLTGAQLYLETWGGHPGTANKRVTLNGRSTYFLPRVGAEEMNCTYSYPSVDLKMTDLVNGYNACQFALDQGKTFWGHMIVDNACLRVALANQHPDLVRPGLDGFRASVIARPLTAPQEGFELSLDCPQPAAVESVDFQGLYLGYDENGNMLARDWHGFTKARQPVAILGSATQAPFRLAWATTMLPAQPAVGVRAFVHFKTLTNLVYSTAATTGLVIPERSAAKVGLYVPRDLPKEFWSRAGHKKSCTIDLDIAPEQIQRAELYVVAWAGGAGTVKDYFKLNGHFFPIAEGAKHELIYSRLDVPPGVLRQGTNQIELLSDTEHHGIEILLPGPCLILRTVAR